ncbi:hypothetical protein V7x_42710 [Crateriforma conspicua]|uniref:Uncharacterized protein n=1 Tax=Crateriforma conspicua TaxID=2527996 RepID=A0A5C6FPX1_9PLAN|nr:hypothetical protein V7x_42710 [Crateriforma conspicua]
MCLKRTCGGLFHTMHGLRGTEGPWRVQDDDWGRCANWVRSFRPPAFTWSLNSNSNRRFRAVIPMTVDDFLRAERPRPFAPTIAKRARSRRRGVPDGSATLLFTDYAFELRICATSFHCPSTFIHTVTYFSI